jgi:hypothetical protein
MLPPWIIAELERKRRERESNEQIRPDLECPPCPRQEPRPEATRGPIVLEF